MKGLKMEKSEYIMSSLEEYFEILDKENKKRSELVAKSLVKYLQKSKEANKFEKLQIAKQVKDYFGKLKKTCGKKLKGKNCKGLHNCSPFCAVVLR